MTSDRKHGEGTGLGFNEEDPFLSNVYADMTAWFLIEGCGPACNDGHCRCDEQR